MVNILFCGDNKVCEGIYLSALSICKNNYAEINFYIMTANIKNHIAINKDFSCALQKRIQQINPKNKVILIDATDVFGAYLPTANMQTRFTPFCMLRLFADMIPQIPDKILYIDTDVMCLKSISELYNMNIENCEIAGVPDRYGKWFFGNILTHNYLNSGVLLLNMKNIRKSHLFAKCRLMCRNKKMFMPDQSALNKLAIKKKLPTKYNEQKKINKNTILKHFTTYFKFFPFFRSVTIKPWNVEKLHNELKIFEFDDIIYEYQRSNINEKSDTNILHN